jgi:hypothetical protein
MKSPVKGKSLTRRYTITLEEGDDFGALLEKSGVKPDENGQYKGGFSLSGEVEAHRKKAANFLEAQGLPSSPLLYKVASKPIKWIDSDRSEDIQKAQMDADLEWRTFGGNAPLELPSVGKRMSPDIDISWADSLPDHGRCLGFKSLHSYIQDIKGYAFDDIEALAAEIVWLCHRIKRGENDSGLATLRLGRISTIFDIYRKRRKTQSANASNPRKSPIGDMVAQLAALDEPAADLWPKLWALLDEEGLSPKEDVGESGLYYEYDHPEENERKPYKRTSFVTAISKARRRD